jgi:predicted GNAT family acetyltransferase
MQKTWARPCWLYDEDLLRYHIDRPTGDLDLAVGVEHRDTGELVSFYALMPRLVHWEGRPTRSVFGSFLTAAAAVRGRGIARALQVRLLAEAQAKGYELYLAMCEVDNTSNASIAASCSELGLSSFVVNTFKYLAQPGGMVATQIAEKSAATRPFDLSCDRKDVESLWASRAELCLHHRIVPSDYDSRYGATQARNFVFEVDGKIAGFIHCLLLSVVDNDRSYRNIYFQDVEPGTLSEGQQLQFLRDVLYELYSCDRYDLAFVPNTGYAPESLFRRCFFRTAARTLNLRLTRLTPSTRAAEAPAPIESFCLDVF